MNILLTKYNICKCVKLYLRCPACQKDIWLDEFVFFSDPKEIYCYKCNTNYYILSIVSKKNNSIGISMMKGSQNGDGKKGT